MDKLNKKIDAIKDILSPSQSHLFVGGDLAASGKNPKEVKEYVKNTYNPPSKNIKSYLITLKINKNSNEPLIINCNEMTITPKLIIKSTDDDGFQTFIYTKNDLLKYGFKMSHIKKIIKAIKTESVSFEKSFIPITDLLKK
jgi:hypothetical protein